MNADANAAKSRREEHTEATRHALLSAGRKAFAREGFQAAGIEAISKAARVTRGAFYHHFEDKKALFDAVVAVMQAEAAARIKEKARALAEQKVSLWDRTLAGIDNYLDICLEPAYGRIVVREAPAVLGNARFRELEEAYPMALLTSGLEALKREGELDFANIEILSRMVDAMICKIAIMLPDAEDPKKLRAHGRQIIGSLLGVFRRT